MVLKPHRRSPIDAVVDWQLRIETEPVERRHKLIAVAVVVVTLGASTVADILDPRAVVDGWRWLGYMVLSAPYFLCAGVGMLGVSGLARKQVWARGYKAGRKSYATSLAEAIDRGMHPIEWLAAEFERDGHLTRVGYFNDIPVDLEVLLPASWRRRTPGEDPH